MNAHFRPPRAVNEPVYAYAPHTPERAALQAELDRRLGIEMDIPMLINGAEVRTGTTHRLAPPFQHAHTLGYAHLGTAAHAQQAIDAALAARTEWELLPWEERAAVFLKAAELISGPRRAFINAATMLAQSKTAHQSEIDAVAELADFLRFNVQYLTEIYAEQPNSEKGLWNRLEYRPLEGFVFAITPFNFTAISGNLPMAPALMGNTVVWKPADSQIYSAWSVMEIFREAGLPAGVINLIYGDGPTIGEVVFNHREFAGLHFTGSTGVFQHLWKTIGNNIAHYKSYPRIVGETGGKDFIVALPDADPQAVATAIVRGAFEFQGQKCSAASRAYLPESLFDEILTHVHAHLGTLKMGPVTDFSNFMGAVIDEKAFDKIAGYIDRAQANPAVEVLAGGGYDKSEGYFIEPTVLLTTDPKAEPICEEIFGPVITLYRYADADVPGMLRLVDETGPYALTGAVFGRDRNKLHKAALALRNAAGNFYLNDKPTGAVVDQQPFGGGRASGTNDKAGSKWNLMRWVSPRTIKENFAPPHAYTYPYQG